VNRSVVIIPTYNEKENIARMVETVMALPKAADLLIVDDNSPDGTAGIVESLMPQFGERLHILKRAGKQGLGTAYIAGFRWALERDYSYICEMDCDFSHNPNDLPRLIEACEQGAGLAIGSRYAGGVVNVVNWPIGRVLLSYYASVYVRMITGMPVADATAGFVCYTRETLERSGIDRVKFKGYAFQIEMKFRAWKYKAILKEIPIIFTDRTAGTSKMNSGIIREALFGVIELRLRSLFGKL
jgi:dolichol-phosphate mannosyltransferase